MISSPVEDLCDKSKISFVSRHIRGITGATRGIDNFFKRYCRVIKRFAIIIVRCILLHVARVFVTTG